ncbi:MAG: type II toxin-antitoxin system VapC family toxin [Akkermansiaceae bacterium]|nr:type II toxin-antitoxin system VapC family toxin [Akkermansiaceae bacterium]
MERIESWLARPHVRLIAASSSHVSEVLNLLEKSTAAGNLTTDAQIAALAKQEKGIIHSNDTDFLKFDKIRWHNPLTGKNLAS